MNRTIRTSILLLILSVTALYSTPAQAVKKQERTVASTDTVLMSRTGTASYYAAKFQGRHTSNGEKLDNEAYTCASYLPYDTWVRVTNLQNGKSVLVRVTDRFHPGGTHLVDLTLRAAKDIDMVRYGIARIRMEVLNPNVVRALLPKDTITIALPHPTVIPLIPVNIPEFRRAQPRCLRRGASMVFVALIRFAARSYNR